MKNINLKRYAIALAMLTTLLPIHCSQNTSPSPTSWKDFLIPAAFALYTGARSLHKSYRTNTDCEEAARQHGTQPAPQKWVDYTRGLLATAGYKNAHTIPVNISISYNNLTMAHNVGYGCGIWIHPELPNIGQGIPGILHQDEHTEDMIKHTLGHEVSHVLYRHGEITEWTEAACRTAGAFLCGYVGQRALQRVLPQATSNTDRLLAGSIGAWVGNQAGSYGGKKVFDKVIKTPLSSHQEKQAEILGAEITNTAVSLANQPSMLPKGTVIDIFSLTKRPSKMHESPLGRYLWWREVARKQGNGHLIQPIPAGTTLDDGSFVAYSIDSSKSLKEALAKIEAANAEYQAQQKARETSRPENT